MKKPNKHRVFIGPIEIAGYYANLAKGLKQIGVDCDYITYTPHSFGYGGESKTPILLRISQRLESVYKNNRNFANKVALSLPSCFLRTLWVFCSIFRYDVFIFGFGHSFMPRNNWDLRVLKCLGKKIISVLSHGSESRPPYIDGSYQSGDGAYQPSPNELLSLTKRNFKRTRRFERYSSIIVGAPFSTSHFLRDKFVTTSAFGIPFDAMVEHTSSPTSVASTQGVGIRILHSPSHPAVKGSPIIQRAVENLRQRGYEINLILLQGKPHSQVIREIKLCDFVVYQIYSDFPMAGFATEAAWFGKPAIVGGYNISLLKRFVPAGMYPPSKTCHPDEIEQAIECLIVNSEERERLGVEAQSFVRDKCNPIEVASRYLRLIQEDIPEDWWVEPQDVVYLEGAGQTIECTIKNIRGMVKHFGVESLHLRHRPDLEKAFLEFAEIEHPS